MTTMRKSTLGILAAATLFVIGSAAWAADPSDQRPPGAAPGTKGISSVTDGQGHPINLGQSVATPNEPGVAAPRVQTVRRGRDWWPFTEPMPPYASFVKRVEAMTEDELLVNTAASINVRDLKSSHELIPKALLLEAGSQLAQPEGYYLVKLRGFTRTQEQIDALTRAGAVLGEYLNINTYIAKIPSSAFAAVKALSFVTFIGDYQPAYKISPRIGSEEIPVTEVTDASTGQPKPWLFEITLHNGVYLNDVLNELGRLRIFPQDNEIVANDAMTVIVTHAPPDAVPAIAAIPGVKWIAEKAYPELTASSTNPAAIPMILQNNGVYTTTTGVGWKLWNAGVDGTATTQIVTMMDSGLDTRMEHFSQDSLNNGTVGPAHRKVVGYDVFGGGDQCVLANSSNDGGHGTKTSQHAVGSISNMTTNPDTTHTPNVNWDNGIARGGKVYFEDIGNSAGSISPPADLGPSITAAIGKGSFVQNHSWGAANNLYDAEASNLDTAMFNNPGMVVTASAGNRGAAGINTLGSPSTAKNAICVGGNDAANPNNLFIDCSWDGLAACSANDLGSSRGPVSGVGRTKPDIMAYIWASTPVGGEQMAIDQPVAMCQTDASKPTHFDYVNLGNEGGTSFAAPDIAGSALLVRDYFMQGLYPTGVAVPANAITPTGALVKAVILASGEAMAATSFPTSTAINTRYSSDVGYGRVNLPGVLHVGSGAPFIWVQNNDSLGQSVTKQFFYNINTNSIPLRVMLSYYDAAGDALQKDADLKVVIGANTYWGNNFSSSWSTTATSTRDHTNNTEGVFLDAAHGLPASGTVEVDVIGFNNPGGMNYSLVVSGDVASSAVTQVSMDKGSYTCNDTVKITVNDASATSPVSVTLVSKNASSTTIDTQIVSCSGSNGVFVGTIQTGSGIIVADGGSLTATYVGAANPATAAVSCQIAATDQGAVLSGGCDNASAGTDPINAPLFNGGNNEFYTKYMDAGEYTSYAFNFKNATGVTLKDVYVNVSFSGAGASKMSVFNNPVHIGSVAADAIVGGIFQVFTDPSTAGLTSVNMDFDLTSIPDGYTVAKRITQVQLLQANDVVVRQSSCSTFTTSLSPFAASTPVTGRAANQWIWSGSATTPSTVSSENRTDGACGSATVNAAAMTGNSGTTTNFASNADNFLFLSFAPANRGNGPSGQPYHYAWKWHSFYHASEAGSNTSGVWGAFYNDKWNTGTAPTGDQLKNFPIVLAYYYQTIFDYPSGGTGSWNWETANTGTPDDPHLNPNTGGAPNQIIITFGGVTGLATTSTIFSYGHEHADIFFFNGGTSHGTHRDIALDNDRLVYDEYYAAAQAGASCGAGGQVGQVAFERTLYTTCPGGPAIVSVTDANGVSGMQVTVTSSGTGDSEVVTLTGTAPYFSGTLNYSDNSGVGANNGVLFVVPSDTITATYTDSSPAGTSTASTTIACPAGNVVYVSNAQISDNGDNDGIADNNETVTMDITVQNNLTTPLTNAKVTIYSASPNVDCVPDAQALYGTIPAGGSATNPISDRFQFHVAPSVMCTDPTNPPSATFVVVISGDGLDAPATMQSFNLLLDLDPTSTGGPYTLTQNFNANPGWATGVTPDDDGNAACGPYGNAFHWCSVCGNGNGGYGAWTGNQPFGTSGQEYPDLSSSTLYSPPLVANGNVTISFDVAYRTETPYDGAIVQYNLAGGGWTTLGFTTPAQSATFTGDACSPLKVGETAWTGTATGTTWTTTSTSTVAATTGQSIQFRWRLGTDSSVEGAGYGGYGVDNVVIGNLKQTVVCEPTRNTGLPSCTFCQLNPDGTSCDDGNSCTTADTCAGGVCSGIPGTTPAEAQGVTAAADKVTYSWSPVAGATRYDVLRGLISALPVGPGGGDESCFDNLGATSVIDATVPAPGTGFFYLSRGENGCGNGTYGFQSNLTERTSTTCP
jgi:hypothetical protein